jgi:FtsP/CotA-like multicopper oxidase with cupredoxin domain
MQKLLVFLLIFQQLFQISQSTPTNQSIYRDTWIIRESVFNPDGYPRPVFGVFRKQDIQPTSGKYPNDQLNVPIVPFPGPRVSVKQGDWVEITVINQLEDVEISIHWHGIKMKGNAWMDGAFGITQCGIQPKGKFVYRFQVNQGPGTYWWHSHAPEQYADGLYGAFIIEEEEEEEKEFAGDYVVFIQDWHHETYHTNSAKYLNRIGEFPGFVPNYPWPSENVIINGRGQFECKWISEEDCIDIRKWGWNWFLKNASKMPEPTLREEQSGQCQPIRPPFIGRCIPKPKRLPRSCYEPKTLPDKSEDVLDFGDCPSLNASEYSELICYPGKKIKIRLINSGESLPLKFWVDRHNLTIISKDGVKVVPDGPHYAVFINLGQRLELELNCSNDPQLSYQFFASTALEFYPGSYLRQPFQYAYGILKYFTNSSDQQEKKKLAFPLFFPSGCNATLTRSYGNSSTTYLPLKELELEPLESEKKIIPPSYDRVFVHARSDGNWFDDYGKTLEWWWINEDSPMRFPAQPVLQAKHFGYSLEDELVFGPNPPNVQKLLYDPDNPKWYEIVLINYDGQQHPWHLHGHLKHIVGYGWLRPDKWKKKHTYAGTALVNGTFQYNASEYGLAEYYQETRAKAVVDTITIAPYSFIVFRILVDNPGPWVFHCHMEYHISAGLAMIFSAETSDGRYPISFPPPADFQVCGSVAVMGRLFNSSNSAPSSDESNRISNSSIVTVAIISGIASGIGTLVLGILVYNYYMRHRNLRLSFSSSLRSSESQQLQFTKISSQD